MKKILIIGKNSYIGSSFSSFLAGDESVAAEGISLRDPSWRDSSFAGYDAALFAVGLAHVKETAENAASYYEINRDLALEAAKKAKADGVRQFIYLSSMSVYGKNRGVITPETKPEPNTHYGRSKLEAEQGLRQLEDGQFKVCIVRPPMVYGKGCKGNFQTMIKLVSVSPVFPRLKNKRSMIAVENLCGFLKLAAEERLSGIWFPQNRELVCTSDMAQWIAEGMGKKLVLSSAAGLAVRALVPFWKTAQKAFGSLYYEGTEALGFRYCTTDNHSSIRHAAGR